MTAAKAPDDWGRGVFQTVMWMLHLIGGGVWVGGLIGLVLLAVRSGLDSGFSSSIRQAWLNFASARLKRLESR